jgi:hypothetical protein
MLEPPIAQRAAKSRTGGIKAPLAYSMLIPRCHGRSNLPPPDLVKGGAHANRDGLDRIRIIVDSTPVSLRRTNFLTVI